MIYVDIFGVDFPTFEALYCILKGRIELINKCMFSVELKLADMGKFGGVLISFTFLGVPNNWSIRRNNKEGQTQAKFLVLKTDEKAKNM